MRKNLLLLLGVSVLLTIQVGAQTANNTPNCPMGYWWDTQKCEKCAANCSSCDVNNKCKDCMDGYYKEGDTCQSCGGLEGVQTCCTVAKDPWAIRALSCLTEQGYVLQGSVCIKPDVNCKTRIAKSYICSECKDGYYLDSDNICQMPTTQITGCRVYTNAKTCKVCMDNYFLKFLDSLNSFGCEQCDENCICKSAEKQCDSCMAQNGDDAIYQKEVDGKVTCNKCMFGEGSFAPDNKLYTKPASCVDDKGCLGGTCPENAICIQQSDGKNYCQAVIGCLKATLGTGTPPGLECQECMTGYYMTAQKTCSKCPKTDKETDLGEDKFILKKCDKPNLTSNDAVWVQCPHNSLLAPPFNEQEYLVDQPNNGGGTQKICKKNINSCKQMKDVDQLCTACYDDMGYILKSGICKLCSAEIDKCTKCSLKSGSTTDYQCDMCMTGYYPKQDKSGCIKYPDNIVSCTTLKDDTSLLAGCTCMTGYKIVKGKENECEICTDNTVNSITCKTCGTKADENVCKECVDGYGLVSGKCQPCTDKCKRCDSNKEICKECMAGNFLLGDFCSPMRSLCSMQDKDGCSQCKYNAYKSNQHCLTCIDQPSNFKAYNNIYLDDKCPKIDNAATCTSIAPPTPNPSNSTSTSTSSTSQTSSTINSNSTDSTGSNTSTTSSSNIISMVLMVVSFVILALF